MICINSQTFESQTKALFVHRESDIAVFTWEANGSHFELFLTLKYSVITVVKHDTTKFGFFWI